jgi:hypothetical protein
MIAYGTSRAAGRGPAVRRSPAGCAGHGRWCRQPLHHRARYDWCRSPAGISAKNWRDTLSPYHEPRRTPPSAAISTHVSAHAENYCPRGFILLDEPPLLTSNSLLLSGLHPATHDPEQLPAVPVMDGRLRCQEQGPPLDESCGYPRARGKRFWTQPGRPCGTLTPRIPGSRLAPPCSQKRERFLPAVILKTLPMA